MKDELELMLYEDFPELFARRFLPMSQSNMCYGMQHGDGWFNLINNMCIAIQGHIDDSNQQRVLAIKHSTAFYAKDLENLPKYMHSAALAGDVTILPKIANEIAQVEFEVIKEKFGGLRIHAEKCDEFSKGVIDMTENMSMDTCENTGKPGMMYIKDKRQLRTLCPEEAPESEGWFRDFSNTFRSPRRSQPVKLLQFLKTQ